MGVIEQADGRTALAEGYYRAALDTAPDFVPALFNLAILRTEGGRHPGGHRPLRARDRDPSPSTRPPTSTSVCSTATPDELKLAQQHLNTAIELDPSFADRITLDETPTACASRLLEPEAQRVGVAVVPAILPGPQTAGALARNPFGVPAEAEKRRRFALMRRVSAVCGDALFHVRRRDAQTEPNTRKVERVAELKERIERSDALLLTEYRGLTVSEITELRRSLAEGGTKFAVVKNTLMRRAVNDAGVAELEPLLEGPSAVAFVEGDPVAAAKSVVDAAKKFPTLVLKGGFMDGKLLSADEAKALASLESREVMLSKIAGLMKSEMSKAAALFVGAQSKFLSACSRPTRTSSPARTWPRQPRRRPRSTGRRGVRRGAPAPRQLRRDAEAPRRADEPDRATTNDRGRGFGQRRGGVSRWPS